MMRQNVPRLSLLGTIFLLTLFFVGLYVHITNTTQAYSSTRVQSLARSSAHVLNDWFASQARYAEMVAGLASNPHEAAVLFDILSRLITHANQDITIAMHLDGTGVTLFDRIGVKTFAPEEGKTSTWLKVFAAADSRVRLFGPLPSLRDAAKELLFARALTDERGRRFGAVAARVPLPKMEEKIYSMRALGLGGRRFIVTHEASGLVLPEKSQVGGMDGILDDPALPSLLTDDFSRSVLPRYTLGDVEYLIGKAEVGDSGWTLYALSPSTYEFSIGPLLMGAFGATWLGLCVLLCLFHYHSQKHGQYKVLSRLDPLTNTGNRLAFEHALKQLQKQKTFPVCLIILDVDGLKLLNDTFGHKAGDALLRRVAYLLQRCLRENDRIFRIGGDEFAVIVPGATYHITQGLVERINTQAALMREKTNLPPIFVSQGLAEARDPADLAVLFAKADKAMYANKHRRREVARRAIERWITDHGQNLNDRRK